MLQCVPQRFIKRSRISSFRIMRANLARERTSDDCLILREVAWEERLTVFVSLSFIHSMFKIRNLMFISPLPYLLWGGADRGTSRDGIVCL